MLRLTFFQLNAAKNFRTNARLRFSGHLAGFGKSDLRIWALLTPASVSSLCTCWLCWATCSLAAGSPALYSRAILFTVTAWQQGNHWERGIPSTCESYVICIGICLFQPEPVGWLVSLLSKNILSMIVKRIPLCSFGTSRETVTILVYLYMYLVLGSGTASSGTKSYVISTETYTLKTIQWQHIVVLCIAYC